MKLSKKNLMITGVLAAVLVIGLVLTALKKPAEEETVSVEEGSYTLEERKVANTVTEYLEGYLALEEAAQNQISDFAVDNYKVILSSGTQELSDEHTAALQDAIKNQLNQTLPSAAQLTDDDLNALASGISAIIVERILAQLEASGFEESNEFMELANSLQQQVDELKQRSMSINVSANIRGKADYVDAVTELDEKYDTSIGNLENQLSEISSRADALTDGEDGRDGRDGTDGDDGEDGEDGKDGRKGVDGEDGKDGAVGEDGAAGRDGISGAAGKDGTTGKDGIDGQNGTDGKSTFVAYADTATGEGFSLTPKESSKCIGTCITSEAKQPTDPAAYTWQVYRTYFLTSATDENGITTLYIK